MEKTIQTIPFLRLSVALAVGILLGSYIPFPIWFSVISLFFFLLLQIFLGLKYRFSFDAFYGVVIHLFLISSGLFLYQQINRPPHFFENGKFVATVLEAPQEKQNSYKSLLKIEDFLSNDSIAKTNEKVLVYFEKETSAGKLLPGEKIIFTTTPQFIKNNGNPFEFDYKKYMERKKIFRQVYLSSENWLPAALPHSKTLTIKAELARMKLLEIYKKQKLGEDEFEILSALTLGYKRDLDPEIQQVFSASGAMHVLAVSGLHVGIVYGFLALLFGFLNRKRAGKLIFTVISILALWSFAFITGLSPSVMRASTMFSFVILGKYSNRQTTIYNTLASSAFILLVINPNNIFDVGFQLSYSAVFGIVFLQPKLAALFSARNKILNYFLALITVSVAAQVATFPFAIYYFNQFPTYFWISNLFVIPAAIVLIPLAIAMLVFSGIPVFAALLSQVVNFIISLLYFLLKEIEGLPWSVIKIAIIRTEFLLILFLLFLVFILISTKNIKHIKVILVVLFLLITTSTISKFKTQTQREIIVYNNSQNRVIHLISGRTNYVITDEKLPENSFEEEQIQNTVVAMHLREPVFIDKNSFYRDTAILLRNGVILFEDKLILINRSPVQLPQNNKPDIIIDPPANKQPGDLTTDIPVVITGKSYHKKDEENVHFYEVANRGAFRKKW